MNAGSIALMLCNCAYALMAHAASEEPPPRPPPAGIAFSTEIKSSPLAVVASSAVVSSPAAASLSVAVSPPVAVSLFSAVLSFAFFSALSSCMSSDISGEHLVGEHLAKNGSSKRCSSRSIALKIRLSLQERVLSESR